MENRVRSFDPPVLLPCLALVVLLLAAGCVGAPAPRLAYEPGALDAAADATGASPVEPARSSASPAARDALKAALGWIVDDAAGTEVELRPSELAAPTLPAELVLAETGKVEER